MAHAARTKKSREPRAVITARNSAAMPGELNYSKKTKRQAAWPTAAAHGCGVWVGLFFNNFFLMIYFTTSTPQAIATTAPGRRRPAVHTPRRRRRRRRRRRPRPPVRSGPVRVRVRVRVRVVSCRVVSCPVQSGPRSVVLRGCHSRVTRASRARRERTHTLH